MRATGLATVTRVNDALDYHEKQAVKIIRAGHGLCWPCVEGSIADERLLAVIVSKNWPCMSPSMVCKCGDAHSRALEAASHCGG